MAGPFSTGMEGPDAVDWLNGLWQRAGGVYSLTDAATIVVDIAQYERIYEVTLGGNRVFTFSGHDTNGNTVALGDASLLYLNGKQINLRISQDAVGTRTGTLSTGAHYGTEFTSVILTTTPNATDYVSLIYDHAKSRCDVVAYNRGF